MHTSFQLWHCVFPVSYLRGVRYPTETETAGPTSSGTAGTAETTVSGTGVSAPSSVVLRCSRAYDFANVAERAAWLDVLVALVLYLQSGESRVGYLSKALRRNRLHKRVDEAEAAAGTLAGDVQVQAEVEVQDVDSEDSETEMEIVEEEAPEVEPRRSSRKRGFETAAAAAAAAAADDDTQTAPKSQRLRRA